MSAALVWQASYAAFSATTGNGGSNWSAGTVVLADDDAGTAMFTVANMRPGDTSTKCIQLRYSGSLAASVELYGSVTTTAGKPDLSPHLQIRIDQGTGGTSASCTGFSPDATTPTLFSGTLTGGITPFSTFANWATGLVSAFKPVASSPTDQLYSFRFTVTLDPNAPNTVQGGAAGASFTWEAQNT